MPAPAHSAASDFVSWCTAALEALYAGCHCGRLTIIPEIEPTLTIDPPPEAAISRPAATLHFHSAVTFRSNTWAHSSSVPGQDSLWRQVPALLTRMSRPPSTSAARPVTGPASAVMSASRADTANPC